MTGLAAPLATVVLGWRPLLDPLPLDTYWLLLLPPLAIVLSIVYKAIKLDDLDQLPRQAAFMAAQIIAFMVLAAAALWLLTELA